MHLAMNRTPEGDDYPEESDVALASPKEEPSF